MLTFDSISYQHHQILTTTTSQHRPSQGRKGDALLEKGTIGNNPVGSQDCGASRCPMTAMPRDGFTTKAQPPALWGSLISLKGLAHIREAMGVPFSREADQSGLRVSHELYKSEMMRYQQPCRGRVKIRIGKGRQGGQMGFPKRYGAGHGEGSSRCLFTF